MDKALLFSRNFDELQLPSSSIFFAETLHMFATYQSLQKYVQEFFLFCLDHELFTKIKKDLVSTLRLLFLLIAQDLNKIKKSRSILFSSAKNIKLYNSLSSSKYSIFRTNKPDFLEITDLYVNLGIGFCIT